MADAPIASEVIIVRCPPTSIESSFCSDVPIVSATGNLLYLEMLGDPYVYQAMRLGDLSCLSHQLQY